MDWYAFTVAFKGVFLEGLEVAFIVITFGAARVGGVALAAAAGPLGLPQLDASRVLELRLLE